MFWHPLTVVSNFWLSSYMLFLSDLYVYVQWITCGVQKFDILLDLALDGSNVGIPLNIQPWLLTWLSEQPCSLLLSYSVLGAVMVVALFILGAILFLSVQLVCISVSCLCHCKTCKSNQEDWRWDSQPPGLWSCWPFSWEWSKKTSQQLSAFLGRPSLIGLAWRSCSRISLDRDTQVSQMWSILVKVFLSQLFKTFHAILRINMHHVLRTCTKYLKHASQTYNSHYSNIW